MRPEVAAFRELDALVRKLTGQLAAYRRRAMSAESRVKELEHDLGRAVEKGEAALSAARAETAAVRRLLEENAVSLHHAMNAAPEVGSAKSQPDGDDPNRTAVESAQKSVEQPDLSTYGDIAVENQRLRTLLTEAKARTQLLVDRVHFLRQQLTEGASR